jgi:hypothetical protein
MSQFRDTTVTRRVPRYGPGARRVEGGALQRPHGMLRTKIRPIVAVARWTARPTTAVLAYLACMGARVRTLD